MHNQHETSKEFRGIHLKRAVGDHRLGRHSRSAGMLFVEHRQRIDASFSVVRRWNGFEVMKEGIVPVQVKQRYSNVVSAPGASAFESSPFEGIAVEGTRRKYIY